MTQQTISRDLGFTTYLPGQPGYDEHRAQPFNPALDARPALVARALTAHDVRMAVLEARERDLPLAVQSTGHGTHVPANGGLLLKTTDMSGVRVDPHRRVAKAGPGARWADVLAAAAPYGLAPLSGSSPTVGVTGYTLGGGLGWLARRYGFAADSVLAAQVVTADGRIVTADAEHHPELFWALRGGGGNFGVVTSLEFELHPVGQVCAGLLTFAVTDAAEQLAAYRDWAAGLPPELSTAAVLTPDRTLVIKAMGETGGTRELAAPLIRRLGPVLDGELRDIPYASAAMGGTPARTLELYDSLPDAVLEAAAAVGDAAVEVRHWGGALAERGPDDAPVSHRDTEFTVIVAKPVALPYATGRSFLNFLADPARAHRAFTPGNFERLRAVKRIWDPANLFRLNLNIQP
ncbi:FAD-binding oxidoreductase [Nonomuraea typhae]|uniref:FAD-binding oxidoreductase n=1 Tax=Nonomuraea typhae TaxID=2603600 RepID=UPI0012FBD13C|nr:FAD-dependent oxidoreductase [Nonomuraea typhae]